MIEVRARHKEKAGDRKERKSQLVFERIQKEGEPVVAAFLGWGERESESELRDRARERERNGNMVILRFFPFKSHSIKTCT